jgi:hypothetical protein
MSQHPPYIGKSLIKIPVVSLTGYGLPDTATLLQKGRVRLVVRRSGLLLLRPPFPPAAVQLREAAGSEPGHGGSVEARVDARQGTHPGPGGGQDHADHRVGAPESEGRRRRHVSLVQQDHHRGSINDSASMLPS